MTNAEEEKQWYKSKMKTEIGISWFGKKGMYTLFYPRPGELGPGTLRPEPFDKPNKQSMNSNLPPNISEKSIDEAIISDIDWDLIEEWYENNETLKEEFSGLEFKKIAQFGQDIIAERYFKLTFNKGGVNGLPS